MIYEYLDAIDSVRQYFPFFPETTVHDGTKFILAIFSSISFQNISSPTVQLQNGDNKNSRKQ
jgi:hypothetical protein